MSPSTEQEYKTKIEELQKEIEIFKKKQTEKMKSEKYGLNWIDVPEAFEKESENKIPVLKEVKEKAIKNDDGKPTHILIEGDNYHALKCLNYTHAGKIDVIYIDPPYNTGNDGFSYRDSRFLTEYPDGKPISKDDPLRHSSWLSFMSKRLKLAKNLLSEKGVIFISIDDNEQANLKLLCDQVFGEENFVGQLILKTATDNNPSQINTEHEYMLCYCKKEELQGNWQRTSEGAIKIRNEYFKIKQNESDITEIQRKLRQWIKQNKKFLPQVEHYNNVDEKGVYSSSSNSSNPHPGGYNYDILHPNTHKACPKPQNGWRWPYATFRQFDELGEIAWGVDETTQPHVKKRIETSTEYLRTLIYEDNRATTMALSEIFNGKKVFDNPKPSNVLSRIFDFTTSNFSTILDFFAGSGTTLHATMKLNAEDGGNRQCILVQQKETESNICETVTYERNRRVMQGYTNAKGEEIPGLGNSLKYYKTDFVGGHSEKLANDEDRIILAQKAGCLISLCENTLEEIKTTEYYQFYSDGRKLTAIYFNEDPEMFPEFVKDIRKISAEETTSHKTTVYVYCEGNPDIYENEFDDLSDIEIKAIPYPILQIYKTLNETH